MNKRLKKFYPEDKTFCMYGDECSITCHRKISDYELKLLNYEVDFEDFRNTIECHLKYEYC